MLTWLTRLSGDTSTACLLTVPARPIRVESSLGPELIIADTRTCSGFCKNQKVLGGSLSLWLFVCLVYKLHIPTTVNKLNAMSSITLWLILLRSSQHFQESQCLCLQGLELRNSEYGGMWRANACHSITSHKIWIYVNTTVTTPNLTNRTDCTKVPRTATNIQQRWTHHVHACPQPCHNSIIPYK